MAMDWQAVNPFREEMLKEEECVTYRQNMDAFFERLVELNIDIYLLEQLLAFPYDLLADGWTDNGFFFQLMIKNTFEASVLLIANMTTDQGSDVLTLPRFKNRLRQMMQTAQHTAFQRYLKGIYFDQKSRALLERVRNLRDTRIAHFIPAASHEFLTLSEIKMVRDDLNALLQALSFDVDYIMLPFSYESGQSDVEWALDAIAKSSPLLTMPEQDPERWLHRRSTFTESETAQLNHYRKKFGWTEI